VRLHGVIRGAELQAHPPGSDRVEMVLELQGVSPGQPRRIVVPYEMLLEDPSLDPDEVTGRRFDGDTEEDAPGRHVVRRIELGARVLRSKP
jgi:hypothetical protein